jgi:hypothetical protein
MNAPSTRGRMAAGRRIKPAAVVVAVILVLSACSGAGPASATPGPSASLPPPASASVAASASPPPPSPSDSASATALSVASTLAGLADLPRRVHWEAKPVGSVTEVDFLIDGQLAWVEHNAPYFYGDDGNWLVSSFLTPGPHVFVTRAVGPGGQTAAETVNAKVAAAPAPPADIAGHWTRSTTGRTSGVWSVTINSIGWLFDDPQGGGQSQDVEYPAKGRITTHAFIAEPPFPNPRNGSFCGDPIDPDGTFSYMVSADGRTLTVTAAAPLCYQDAFEGTWARAR